ncbi:energy transducer TonB [Pontiella agarivorans]|uniref:Energy transducer TonB n=1 Tax=Pontiella agarivorans TaxID=3038953 RepID=A0ABU5MV91_9BACT|nr:energy transducer TonB [Pontiella agarivorans]MDZ8118146.1 energy transducer TonB [Pontiella agarivorans]
MSTLQLQLNRETSWIRWPIAVVFSLAMNLLLLGSIIQQTKPEAVSEPVYTASVFEEPPPPEPQPQTQVSAGASSSAWKPVLPSAADVPARPPVSDIPFDMHAPLEVDLSALPVPGHFSPDLGNYVIAAETGGRVNLDREASMLNRSVFDRFYPSAARVRRIRGVSVIEFDISESGKVTGARLISSEPRGIFDKAALKGAGYARFQPAVADGKPVAVTKRIRLEWVPPGAR